MAEAIFPRMFSVRQAVPESPALDIRKTVNAELSTLLNELKPGVRIGVTVGSRGIRNIRSITQAVLDSLREAGAQPILLPAMGSHGGATPEGQLELLSEYGITSDSMQVPIEAEMETASLGTTPDGVEVFFSKAALQCDGVVLLNRIKPHTDFSGKLGSGLLKIMVVGLGKRDGAAVFHRASNRLGFEHVLRTASRVILESAPILCGLGIVEDARHQTALLRALPPAEMERGEEELFKEAARLMPRLPFDAADLLIVDQVGKNISGAGMDPNIIGRSVHGYSSLLVDRDQDSPAVRRLFVRDMTPESHGNATGIGMADFTTTRFVQSIDRRKSTINTLTAMTPQGVKIPVYFDTDQEVIAAALDTLALTSGTETTRVMRIVDTLSLEHVALSEAYLAETRKRPDLKMVDEPREMAFDEEGNLAAW